MGSANIIPWMAALARRRRGVAAATVMATLMLAAPLSHACAQTSDGAAAAAGEATAPAQQPAAPPPLNQVRPLGAVVEDPEAEAKREVYASCLSAQFPDDFARWQDINGDGEADGLFTFNVVCDGYRRALCGIEGCPGAVFVSTGDGGFVKTDLPPDAAPAEPYQGRPTVAVSLTGENCRRGVRLCRALRVWNGAAFVKPEDLYAVAPTGGASDGASAEAPPAPRPPAPTEAEIAIAAEDYEATVALFDQLGPAPDIEIEARIDALAEAGALRVARGWRAFRPSEEWSYEPLGRGRARAWVRGSFGASDVQIACRAGEPTAAIAFFSREGLFGRVFRSGVAAPADVVIAGQLRETVLLRYVRRRDVWVGRINPQGALIEWLRRGSEAYFLEPGAYVRGGPPAARFRLSGSARAIDAAFQACGLI